ncbi:putative endonuclease [Paracoccus isoporae]|uniref:Putative endonuclease n=2 Tax=Paracoccus isoporae TaxID=591205 RepID=A0A1G7GNC6_9RHOB|nr:putative endonuclease [Paracoccus isoporae]
MQLSLDFDAEPRGLPTPGRCSRSQEMPKNIPAARRRRGAKAFQSGLLAEDNVARHYQERGYTLLQSRWRGRAGEVDLILRKDALYVFVEVKAAAEFALAAARIDRRQMDRICLAACEFCERLPTGQMTEMRMDAALVDRFGRIEIVENAFGWH